MQDIRIAKIFDSHDATRRAVMSPYRQRLTDQAERARALEYLENGANVLTTDGLDEDRVSPERGKVVPMSFLTDGTWVWSLGLAYYLAEYRYAPEPDLLAHLRSRNYRIPEVSRDQLTAAENAVLGRDHRPS